MEGDTRFWRSHTGIIVHPVSTLTLYVLLCIIALQPQCFTGNKLIDYFNMCVGLDLKEREREQSHLRKQCNLKSCRESTTHTQVMLTAHIKDLEMSNTSSLMTDEYESMLLCNKRKLVSSF